MCCLGVEESLEPVGYSMWKKVLNVILLASAFRPALKESEEMLKTSDKMSQSPYFMLSEPFRSNQRSVIPRVLQRGELSHCMSFNIKARCQAIMAANQLSH